MKSFLNKYKCQAISMTVVFFLLVCGYALNNEILFSDSYGYISNSITRFAGYPIFLDVFELVFGEQYYSYVIVFQTMFLSYAITTMVFFVKKTFNINKFWTYSLLLGIVFCNIMPSLVSRTGVLLYKSILTEGLGYPLMLIISRKILEAIFNNSTKELFSVIPIIMVASFIRTQYFFTLVILVIAYLYLYFIKRKREISLVKGFSISILSIVIVSLSTSTYQYIYNGRFIGAQLQSSSLTGKLLYLSNIEDYSLMDSDLAQSVVRITLAEGEEKNLTQSATQEMSMFEKFIHYEVNYDVLYHQIYRIQFDEMTNLDTPDFEIYLEEESTKINMTLLAENFIDYLQLTIVSGIVGLIRSNSVFIGPSFKLQQVFTLYSLIIYIISMVLTYKSFKRDKDSKAGKMMLFSYLFILGNAAPSILFHYPLSRFTLISLIIFYISFFVLIHSEVLNDKFAGFIKSKT